jgi:NTP pyrophosphatase (non-canonical NTP hydrolase)
MLPRENLEIQARRLLLYRFIILCFVIFAVEVYVVDLECMKREIEALVLAKGFYNSREDVPKKLLFAFIELGEAADAWKKGLGEEVVAEELVDVIFYVLDASRLACPSVNMDEMFRKKLEKNWKRPYQYGEGHRKTGK